MMITYNPIILRVIVFSAQKRQYICLISPKIKPFMSPLLLPPSVSPKVIPFHLPIFICNTVHYYSQPMAMNTRDERLYHYEYRRPRMHNPTYNSINVFDSLNMFVRNDFPSPLMRSYGKYSLNKEETPMNQSEIINSRYYRPNENLSTIQPPRQAPRREVMLNDKDYLYLQMIDEKNRRTRNSRNYDYGMGGSRLSENAENRQYQMKGGDSLAKEVKQFQARREE